MEYFIGGVRWGWLRLIFLSGVFDLAIAIFSKIGSDFDKEKLHRDLQRARP